MEIFYLTVWKDEVWPQNLQYEDLQTWAFLLSWELSGDHIPSLIPPIQLLQDSWPGLAWPSHMNEHLLEGTWYCQLSFDFLGLGCSCVAFSSTWSSSVPLLWDNMSHNCCRQDSCTICKDMNLINICGLALLLYIFQANDSLIVSLLGGRMGSEVPQCSSWSTWGEDNWHTCSLNFRMYIQHKCWLEMLCFFNN